MEFLIAAGLVLNLVSICSNFYLLLKITSAMDVSERDIKERYHTAQSFNSRQFQSILDKLDSVLVKAKMIDPEEKWGNLKNAFSTGRPNERS